MRSNKRNNKLSYFLTLLLCLCMLVGCGSGAATQVMLKAEDSETEYCIYSYINIQNDTKKRWQLNSCHAISLYLSKLLTKS